MIFIGRIVTQSSLWKNHSFNLHACLSIRVFVRFKCLGSNFSLRTPDIVFLVHFKAIIVLSVANRCFLNCNSIFGFVFSSLGKPLSKDSIGLRSSGVLNCFKSVRSQLFSFLFQISFIHVFGE